MLDALNEAEKEEVAWKYVPLSGPAIDETHSGNVTFQLDKTAVLNCRIKYSGGKTVRIARNGIILLHRMIFSRKNISKILVG